MSHDYHCRSHDFHMTITACHMTITACHMTITDCHMTVTSCHMTITDCHMSTSCSSNESFHCNCNEHDQAHESHNGWQNSETWPLVQQFAYSKRQVLEWANYTQVRHCKQEMCYVLEMTLTCVRLHSYCHWSLPISVCTAAELGHPLWYHWRDWRARRDVWHPRE